MNQAKIFIPCFGLKMQKENKPINVCVKTSRKRSWWIHTCFWVDAERTLQQMVHTFTDVHVEPWVTVLQHDFFLKVLSLLGRGLKWETYRYWAEDSPGEDDRGRGAAGERKTKEETNFTQKKKKKPPKTSANRLTCFLLARSFTCLHRFSGFLSFWKSCCRSFRTCENPVKVTTENYFKVDNMFVFSF